MSEEQQQQQEKKYPAPTSAKFASGALITALPVLAHFGPTGLLLSGIAGFVAYRHGPEVYDLIRNDLSFLPSLEGRREPRVRTPGERTMWERLIGAPALHDEQEEQEQESQDEQEDGFVTGEQESSVPGIPRFTVEQICEHITPNSYKIYIGRSLTLSRNPALSINFFRRHLKVIGASQKGKSSMAAALLEIMLRTHDEKHLLVALLDMENRTSKLFENDPHIARVRFPDGSETALHARSKEQVLEHLELLVYILDSRATMTVAQVRAQPLIVIYLEEFLLLKKELKQRASRLTGEAKERAAADYERLVFCVNQLAGRGLKYNLQLLICAQVDYRDDDLYEAFANVTAGFCFCVRATAAASAGFMQTELLNQNAKNNKVGQCVVETPDGHDLILAPDYDLEAKLTALENSVHHSPRSPSNALPELRTAPGNTSLVNTENMVNWPVKPGERPVNVGECSPASENVHRPFTQSGENVSPAYTQSDEVKILLAWAELQRSGDGKPVTRTALMEYLGWNRKTHYSQIVKPVCDKHHIAEREA